MADKGHDEFEIIDSSEASYVRRGRPSSINPALVDKLRTLPAGKTMAIRSLAQNPASPDYRKDKARIASQIRNACRAAGLGEFDIRWSVEGVPQVMRWL